MHHLFHKAVDYFAHDANSKKLPLHEFNINNVNVYHPKDPPWMTG
jgi:hypothetical protein